MTAATRSRKAIEGRETGMGDEREARRENEEPETEGHYRMRANEPGPDAENDDPQAREARRENEEPDDDAENEGHIRPR